MEMYYYQSKKWDSKNVPKRVLFIRLQAMGDVVITLPYIQGFRRNYPDTKVDFLTRDESAPIPESLELFDHVFKIGGGRNTKFQLLHAILFLLKAKSYDVVIDLQNNKISRIVRKGLFPDCWASFDRHSPIPAGERTANTIVSTGLGEATFDPDFIVKDDSSALNLLHQNGWDGKSKLVVLNPAGFFITRNWPLENYLKFAQLWLKKDKNTQFLIVGIDRVKDSATYLKNKLGNQLIDLTGLTTAAEAFSIIQKTAFVLSEDSGLMHMAWVSGIPTIALFGSSRSDWSRPLGAHSLCLNSSDLECGECMEAECTFGDVRCLTRYSPEFVFQQVTELFKKIKLTPCAN